VALSPCTSLSHASAELLDYEASWFNTTLDITGQLFAKNQILGAERAGRAQERDGQPQEVPGYSDDRSRQLHHAIIMPESARVCRRRTGK